MSKNCFAMYITPTGEERCSALIEKDCQNCHFYRNDIKRSDIEQDITDYAGPAKIKKERRKNGNRL